MYLVNTSYSLKAAFDTYLHSSGRAKAYFFGGTPPASLAEIPFDFMNPAEFFKHCIGANSITRYSDNRNAAIGETGFGFRGKYENYNTHMLPAGIRTENGDMTLDKNIVTPRVVYPENWAKDSVEVTHESLIADLATNAHDVKSYWTEVQNVTRSARAGTYIQWNGHASAYFSGYIQSNPDDFVYMIYEYDKERDFSGVFLARDNSMSNNLPNYATVEYWDSVGEQWVEVMPKTQVRYNTEEVGYRVDQAITTSKFRVGVSEVTSSRNPAYYFFGLTDADRDDITGEGDTITWCLLMNDNVQISHDIQHYYNPRAEWSVVLMDCGIPGEDVSMMLADKKVNFYSTPVVLFTGIEMGE